MLIGPVATRTVHERKLKLFKARRKKRSERKPSGPLHQLVDGFPWGQLLDHAPREAAGFDGGWVEAVPLEKADPLLEVLDA